jgi:protein TonB
MSPTAAGLAAMLHLLTALALWWVSPLKQIDIPDAPIEVTMEEPPKPEPTPQPEPPKSPGATTAPAPTTPAPTGRLGLPPTEAKPTPTDKTNVPLGLPSPSQRSTEPPQQAAAQTAPPPKEAPTAEPPPAPEQKLPAVEAPPAPLSMQDFVKVAPPPPPLDIVRPHPRVQPTPPPTTPTVQPQPQQLQPSPLGHAPPQQQQRAPPDSQAAASFVNPADTLSRTRVQDDYLWQVGRKISQHRAFAANNTEQGTVVLRLMIARDGRLMEAGIARSSGFTNLDTAVLGAARQAAPYPPLPAELDGSQITFILPLAYRKFE